MNPSATPRGDWSDDCVVLDRVEKLAQTWQDLHDQGHASSFEEICADDPELIPAVKEWLAKVGQMEAKLATHESVGSTLPGDWNADHILAAAQEPDELGRLGGYRILKLIGQGGMGRVYLAEDVKLKRRVALKVLVRGGDKRFLREAQTLAAIDHDHIVAIYQMDEVNGTMYIAMPLLQGETLDSRLRGGRLPLADTLRIAKQVALGLASAHEHGVVHRDIKPTNIWLEKGNDRVKILDFGLARCDDVESLMTQENAVVGTPGYMSPEQVQGANVDHRCDLFSLGCVLYQMISGKPPFVRRDILSTLRALELETPEAPAVLEPGTPAALSALTMKLLEKKPENRPALARDVVTMIEAIERDPSALPAEAGPAMLLPRRASRIALLGAAAVVLAAIAISSIVQSRRGGDETPQPPTVAAGPQAPEKAVIPPPQPDKAIVDTPKMKASTFAAPPRPQVQFEINVKISAAKNVDDVWQLIANEPFELTLDVDERAYLGVWMFHRSGNAGVTQFFPNSFDADNRFEPRVARTIPGKQKYRLTMPASRDGKADLLLIVASSTGWKWEPKNLQDGFRVFHKETDLQQFITRSILTDDGSTIPRSAVLELPVRFVPRDIAP